MRWRAVVCAMQLLLAALLHGQPAGEGPAIAAEVRRIVERLPDRPRANAAQREAISAFYLARADEPAWFEDGRVIPQARAVVARIESLSTRGLDPRDYGGGRWGAWIQELERDPRAGTIAAFDVAMTHAVARVASDLHGGRVNPGWFDSLPSAEATQLSLPRFIEGVRTSCDVAGNFDSIEPRYDAYRRLLAAHAHYSRLARSEPQPQLPSDLRVKPGDAFPALGALVSFLRATGDLDAAAAATRYDGAVVEAVRRFQRRHGLIEDGILGARTIAAVNVPWSARVRQIELTMERWRWAPASFRRPPIVVNIPEFRLRAYDANGTALSMNVVVGKAYKTETPVFSSEMTHLIFRPYWNVPWSIQKKELVPKILRDPGYLRRNGYEIVTHDGHAAGASGAALAALRSGALALRQRPGANNSLGLVKFMFPNSNNVYMHDTPATSLFSEERRDFSHGCIRVEKPVELAEFVLRDQPGWTRARIEASMHAGPSTQVRLTGPIPVLIVYGTVVVTRDGEVRFFDDVYGHDAELEKELDSWRRGVVAGAMGAMVAGPQGPMVPR